MARGVAAGITSVLSDELKERDARLAALEREVTELREQLGQVRAERTIERSIAKRPPRRAPTGGRTNGRANVDAH